MTTIPGTDLTTEAARNRALRMLNEHDAALMVALADAYDTLAEQSSSAVDAAYQTAIDHAKSIASREKYSPQESAAAWDVVDALATLQTAGTDAPTPDPESDDRDGKQITRAAEHEGDDTCD
jgi:hypothetical protein